MARAQTSLRNSGKWITAFATAALLALAPQAASAGKFKVLHSFCGPKDGCDPEGGLVADAAGNLYGTTLSGGTSNDGTVFELQREDTGKLHYKRIYTFCKKSCDGDDGPAGNLIVDTQGNLYGYGDLAGNRTGDIIELSPPTSGSTKWTKKVLYYFCSQQNCTDGAQPFGGLTYAGAASGEPYDGSSPLFGTASIAGLYGMGTVFQLTNNAGHWTASTLYSFCSKGAPECADGAAPSGGLIMDQAGNLFGLTAYGGSTGYGDTTSGNGVVYELSPNGATWSETVLWIFCHDNHCSDGAKPLGELVADASGNLYSTTVLGGGSCPLSKAGGCGTVFSLVPNGAQSQETVLYRFCRKTDCADGLRPETGLVRNLSGALVGTTFQGGGHDIDYYGRGGGTVFKLTGSKLKVLYAFCALNACDDGEYPISKVYLDSSATVYGTTSEGGSFGEGALYRVKP